jgi:hypothetical protein
MNANVLLLGGGIISGGGNNRRFRMVKLGPVPFLTTVKPVDLAPVHPALGPGVAAGHRGASQARWVGRIERIVLKLVAAVFVVVAMFCALGAQHISYMRARSQLARELRQREAELHAVTRAYWSLEAEKAVQVAGGNLKSEGGVRKAEVGNRNGTPGGGTRATGGAEVGKARVAGQRSQLAETRKPAQRGGIRS